MSQPRTVTVCICTRRRPDDLARTLASLEHSTYPVAQVVVSDDGHDEPTRAACERAVVDVDYVLGPQRGLGANRNHAIQASVGEILTFLDDDCLLLPTFLEIALAHLEEAEQRYGTGRVIVSGRELNRGRLIHASDQTFLGFQAKPYTTNEGWRSVVINAAVFPAEVFRKARFDPQIVYGYEEVDLASRAAAAGYVIVYCADAINDHRPSPRSRHDYQSHVDASRLHVTLRRYAVTERDPMRASAFALVAPLHLLAADVKRAGLGGVRTSARTLGLATRMLWRAGRDRR